MKASKNLNIWFEIVTIFSLLLVFFFTYQRSSSDDLQVLRTDISVLEKKIEGQKTRENHDPIFVKELQRHVVFLKKRHNKLQWRYNGFLMGTPLQEELLLKY